MAEWNGCYCGEFAQPTIAPDEFGETCFHEHDKCEVPTTKVPDQTVIRLLRQKVDRMTERARKAEAGIQRVRELHKVGTNSCPNCGPFCDGCGQEYPCATTYALDGAS